MSRELVALASHNNVGPRLGKFNAKGASREPSPAPAPKPYVLQESGTCASLITTKADCEEAAAVLGLSDKTVTDDGQHGGVVYDPKGCYFEQGSLKYNTYHKNTGGCNSIDKCLCRVPMASTKMVGEEGRPVIKK